MSLADQLAADLTTVFLRTDALGVSAQFRPVKQATTFGLVVAFGDPDETTTDTLMGLSTDRIVRVLAQRSVIRAGIAGIEGVERDAIREDSFEVATGPDAGTWVVQSVSADFGDALQLNVVRSKNRSYAAERVSGVT